MFPPFVKVPLLLQFLSCKSSPFLKVPIFSKFPFQRVPLFLTSSVCKHSLCQLRYKKTVKVYNQPHSSFGCHKMPIHISKRAGLLPPKVSQHPLWVFSEKGSTTLVFNQKALCGGHDFPHFQVFDILGEKIDGNWLSVILFIHTPISRTVLAFPFAAIDQF